MNQSILASRAKLISVNLKIPLTASLKDFEFFGMVVKIFQEVNLASLPTYVGEGFSNGRD